MTITPEIRRANRRVLLGLILFSVALALAVFLWMRVKIRANGGVVDPTYGMQLESQPNFVLDGQRFTASNWTT